MQLSGISDEILNRRLYGIIRGKKILFLKPDHDQKKENL